MKFGSWDLDVNLSRSLSREQKGEISTQRASQYTVFVTFGAYTGQRSNATMVKLTVGQYREALQHEKPCIRVGSSQDKVRLEHYTPLHRQVIDALRPLLNGRDDDDVFLNMKDVLERASAAHKS